jgi:hypothetical protein
MVNEPVIKAVRVVCIGTAVLSFAFAAVSIPLPNRAAVAPPTLPPPVKIVYRHASNPFRMEYAGLDPVSNSSNVQRGSQILPDSHFPTLPVGMMPPLPAGKHVPGISGMSNTLSLTGIVLGRKPLAMIRENNILRTVGVGDIVGGSKIVHITANAVRLANGVRIVPGVAPVAPPEHGFVFPSTMPNGSNKGELPSSIANPNGDLNSQPVAPESSASATPLQQQQNVLQQVQNLTPTAAPAAGPAATTGTTSSGVPPNSTSPGSAATPATQSH